MSRGVGFALRLVSWCALLASVILTALHALPGLQLLGNHLLLSASLIPYGVPLAAVSLALFSLTRARPLVLLLACVVLVAHILIARPYWPGLTSPSSVDPIRMLTMNMRCDRVGTRELERLISEEHPEVAVIQGVGRRSRSELSAALVGLYPTAAFTPMPGLPECGTVVFTRLRFYGWVSWQRHPTAFVRTPGFEFALVAVDFPTPTEGIEAWLDAFDDLIADMPALEGRPVIAVGDFNAVLEHEPMRRLTRETVLRDAVTSSGLGWLPTFPDEGGTPPLVALDHLLVSPGLVATSARTASIPRQEHRALFVTVGIAE